MWTSGALTIQFKPSPEEMNWMRILKEALSAALTAFLAVIIKAISSGFCHREA